MIKEFFGAIISKVNPAQPAIYSQETEAEPANIIEYKEAYNKIDIINRAINMIVNGCLEIPFKI